MLTQTKVGRFFSSKVTNGIIRILSLFIIIVLNVLVLFQNYEADMKANNYTHISDFASDVISLSLRILGFVSLVLIILQTLSFVFIKNLVTIFERYRLIRIQKQAEDSKWLFSKQNILTKFSIIFRCILSGSLFFAIFQVVISLLGLGKPAFYCFLLLDILKDIKVLSSIFHSLTKNWKMLITTALIIILFVVVLSNFLVGWLQDYLITEGGEKVCDTYFNCFLHLIWALPSGGEKTVQWTDPTSIATSIFVFVYWLLLGILTLNMLLAAVIDGLGFVRKEKSDSAEKKKNTCLICGLSRYTLDKYGPGFEQHIKTEHNPADYIHFFITLLESEVNIAHYEQYLTGTEALLLSYLKTERKSMSNHLFPIGKSHSINQNLLSHYISYKSQTSDFSTSSASTDSNTQSSIFNDPAIKELSLSLTAIKKMRQQLSDIEIVLAENKRISKITNCELDNLRQTVKNSYTHLQELKGIG